MIPQFLIDRLDNWLDRFARKPKRSTRKKQRPFELPPAVERLEDRTLLSVFYDLEVIAKSGDKDKAGVEMLGFGHALGAGLSTLPSISGYLKTGMLVELVEACGQSYATPSVGVRLRMSYGRSKFPATVGRHRLSTRDVST